MIGIKFREHSDNPLVSVVIPTKNSGETIETCLKSVREQTWPNIEVIVVDNYSSDDTREIAEKFDAKAIESKVGRSGARNIGAEKAIGEFILFLDSDMELDSTVVRRCVEKVGEHKCDAVIIPEVSVGESFWARCKALEKACYIGDDTIEAARFLKRSAFNIVNGYDPELLFGEDKDLDIRIRKAGFKIGRVNAFLQHHEGKLSLRETMLKKNHYGRTLNRYRRKHSNEAKQQLKLIRPAFIRNWRKLARDPIHALGMFFMKFCEFGAVEWGYVVNKKWFGHEVSTC